MELTKEQRELLVKVPVWTNPVSAQAVKKLFGLNELRSLHGVFVWREGLLVAFSPAQTRGRWFVDVMWPKTLQRLNGPKKR